MGADEADRPQPVGEMGLQGRERCRDGHLPGDHVDVRALQRVQLVEMAHPDRPRRRDGLGELLVGGAEEAHPEGDAAHGQLRREAAHGPIGRWPSGMLGAGCWRITWWLMVMFWLTR